MKKIIPNAPDLYEDPPPERFDELHDRWGEIDAEPVPSVSPALPVDPVDLEPEPLVALDAVEVPASFSDAHVGEKLADALRGNWLYVAAWGRWLRWDGRRWANDETEQVYEAVRQWSIELVVTMSRIGASDDDVKRAAGFRQLPRMKSILEVARRIEGMAAEPGDFDRNPDLLTVENGTVDLRTSELRAHDPGDRITKLAGAVFDPGARHDDAERLLSVVTPEVRAWLQVALGYASTGHVNESLVLVFDGGGGNGKSLLIEALSAALGDHAVPGSPQLVMKGRHDAHPTILAALQGVRVTTLVETEEGGSLRLEQLKAISGGDRITARVMYGDFFDFDPTHQLIIATNHRPLVNTTERAAWRRLRLVPFPHTYRPAHEVDEAAGDRVADRWILDRIRGDEGARAALLAWLIEGARLWYRDGIHRCAEIEAATDAWRQEEDIIGRFVADHVEVDPAGSVSGRDLYDTYRQWCADEGRPPKSNKNFATDFLAAEALPNVERTRGSAGIRYRGVRLR